MTTNIDKLITEHLAIEAEEAKEAGALGYMARALVQATMPHKKVEGNEFTRTNGAFSLSMLAPAAVGLPYGTVPRLLLAWLTTEAVRTRERDLVLGNTLSSFMQQLDMVPTGGRWGTITRLREQLRRLFSSTVSCSYEGAESAGETGFRLADRHVLWWDTKEPSQAALWHSSVTLTERFYEEIINSPVPIDMRALKALKRSPMALDMYVWLTYRMSYLRKPTTIPWGALEAQFGADYKLTRQFKAAFLKHMRKVILVYPDARVDEGDIGLQLRPGKPHVRKLAKG